MRKNARNMRELEEIIRNNVTGVMISHVAPVIKEEQSRQVHEKVYQAYAPEDNNGKPYVYQRRGDNEGLSDIDNMFHSPGFVSRSIVELSVYNLTTSDDGRLIAESVEKGHDASGSASTYDEPNPRRGDGSYLKPRPFMQATVEALRVSGEAGKAWKAGMKAKGFNVK